jgi:hypothetical protein
MTQTDKKIHTFEPQNLDFQTSLNLTKVITEFQAKIWSEINDI